MEELPHEFKMIGKDFEPWKVTDVIRVGRLGSADPNWFAWFKLLDKRKNTAEWAAEWKRLSEFGVQPSPTSFDSNEVEVFKNLIEGFSKGGSNALVIGGEKTDSGAAMLASDPHLGLVAPSFWLAGGVNSPSYNVVGLMAPGIPFFLIGRNEQISWSGTNMRAASSFLIDVTDVPERLIEKRKEDIKVRWWFDDEVEISETPYGPVISEMPMVDGKFKDGEKIAFAWVGHQPSDELTPFFKLMRSESFGEFKDAFAGFSVSGQNMVYADKQGNIGQIMAVALPNRPNKPSEDFVLSKQEAYVYLSKLWRANELPFSYNPDKGYLATANNKPVDFNLKVSDFFPPPDRHYRLSQMSRARDMIDMDYLQEIQMDVYSYSSDKLRIYLQDTKPRLKNLSDSQERFLDSIIGWDAKYGVESKPAVQYEILKFHTLREIEQNAADEFKVTSNIDIIIAAFDKLDDDKFNKTLKKIINAAAKDSDKFANWGEFHRLKWRHPFANIPVLGGRYEIADFPAAGANNTLNKSALDVTNIRHPARYGANARFLTDMAELDSSKLVLLGGQDGWLNSRNFYDQLDLWAKGEYIEMPITREAAEQSFKYVTEFE